jgi:hypothetical protein
VRGIGVPSLECGPSKLVPRSAIPPIGYAAFIRGLLCECSSVEPRDS